MKFLVVENKEQQQNEVVYDIVDFLWENGNEVHISSNYSEAEVQQIIQSCDCIVLLQDHETCFNKAKEAFQNNLALEKSTLKKTFLFFSENGIYTNIIPFPHKIFDYKQLNKNELFRLFFWCRKLNS
ncbi:hypothetical protein QF042_003829 [Pedobacter sp. W3I1]|uniref:hypothetical protein n=1 Tax=Pedobacter sp. W3I1 TaxID=3042291 RepID=UPI00278A8DAD|nr:hypothetical protein [Pedobacter sp. W3I1]MDQ0640264.1 hypothetical protein [Pedobacter sp. W3I1]